MSERPATRNTTHAGRKAFLFALLLCALAFSGSAAEVIGPLPPTPRRTPGEADLSLAERYAMDRFYDEAMELLERAVERRGVSPKVLRVAGFIAQFSGSQRYTERLYAMFRKGAESGFEGWDPEFFRNYAFLLLELGKKDEFVSLLRKVVLLGETEDEKGAYKGAMFEPLGAFFTSLGRPFIGGEDMVESLWNDWEGESKRYLDIGRHMAREMLYPDAIVYLRRAELLASDPSEARVELARAWLAVGDYERAAAAAAGAGDTPEAKELLAAAKERKAPEGGVHPELHPSRVGYASAFMPWPELHFMKINERYIAGITPTMAVEAVERSSGKVVLRDAWRNVVARGKTVAETPIRRLICQKILLDGDLLAACYIDEATRGAEGLVRIYDLTTGGILSDIPLYMTLRTFEAVELVKGRLVAVQNRGAKVWLSVYDARTGKLLWRKSGYDDLICRPLAVGEDDVVLGLSTLGMGVLARFSLSDGTKRWSMNYDFPRIAPYAKILYGMGGEEAENYNIPMTGVPSGGKCWLAVKRKDGSIEFVAVDPRTGMETASVKPPTVPAGGFKKTEGRTLYLDEEGFMCVMDDSGKLLWRLRSEALHFFFDFTPTYTLLPEMDGMRIVETDTGKTFLFLKNIPEGCFDGRTLYTSKMIFDLSRPREAMLSYVERLYRYARTLNEGFDHDLRGAERGMSVVSEGEKILKRFDERQPGLPEVDLALARLCKGKYYSYVKEYFTSWLGARLYEPDKIREGLAEFAPDFDFRWLTRCDSFTGAWDDNGLAYTDFGLRAVLLADPDLRTLVRRPVEYAQGYNIALTPKGIVFFFPGDQNRMGTTYCISRKTGKEVWKKDYPWILNTRQMKWHKGRLYVFTKTGAGGERYTVAVHCLDPATGDEIWTFRPTRPVAHGFFTHHLMDFDDEAVYFGSTDAAVYKVGLADGKVIWRADSLGAKESGRPDCNFGTVRVVDGKVLTHATDGRIYCFSAKDGSVLWTAEIPDYIKKLPEVKNGAPDDTYWVADPVAVGGGLFMAVLNYAGQRSVLAYEIETGKLRWEFKRNMILFNSMLVDEEKGVLYIPVFANGVEKVSLSDGSLLDHIPLQVSTGYKSGPVVLFDMSGRLMKVRLRK